MGDIFILIVVLSFNSGLTSINQEFGSLEKCTVAMAQMALNLSPSSITIRSQGCYRK